MQTSRLPEDAAGTAAPPDVITYTYSFEDALEACRFFQPSLYQWYLLGLGLGVLCGAILVLYGLWFGLAIALFCAALLVMARLAVMDRLVARRRVKSLIGRRVELALDDDGIAWNGPISTGQMPWASVTEVRANVKTVLWIGDRLLLAFAPAQCFATPDQRDEAIAYSRRQLAARGAGDPPPSPA
jgi:hypothetical protein